MAFYHVAVMNAAIAAMDRRERVAAQLAAMTENPPLPFAPIVIDDYDAAAVDSAAPVAAAPAATSARIAQLQRENEECLTTGVRFSRACGVCLAESPLQRAVFATCGHLLCLACAERINVLAVEECRTLQCPFCKKDGGFVKIFESVIENAAN